ncbi:MAG: DUF3347 domain-containing protein [Ignavibacteriae bacterium]|nr:DUF3347 domain-containing protein [Ignavibacteriota bacterium]
MKIKFKIIVLITFLIVVSSCQKNQPDKQREKTGDTVGQNDMHKQHKSLADNLAHKDIIILETPYQISEASQEELQKVLEAYLEIKDALVASDVPAADVNAKKMADNIAGVSTSGMKEAGLKAWENHSDLYNKKLQEMIHIDGLENKRSYFSHISEIMYCTIKSFGLKSGTTYVVYCPMAFDRKGAYWLSKDKEIMNPYFGEKMLKCGEIKEEL